MYIGSLAKPDERSVRGPGLHHPDPGGWNTCGLLRGDKIVRPIGGHNKQKAARSLGITTDEEQLWTDARFNRQLIVVALI
jgi:hypothetical protein